MFGESNNKRSYRVSKMSNGYTVELVTGNMFSEPQKLIAKDWKEVMKIIDDNKL